MASTDITENPWQQGRDSASGHGPYPSLWVTVTYRLHTHTVFLTHSSVQGVLHAIGLTLHTLANSSLSSLDLCLLSPTNLLQRETWSRPPKCWCRFMWALVTGLGVGQRHGDYLVCLFQTASAHHQLVGVNKLLFQRGLTWMLHRNTCKMKY